MALSAAGYQPIYGGFARFRTHMRARSGVISALVRKAILAATIAVMTDMKTERLDLVRLDGRGGHLLFVEESRILQTLDVGKGGFEFFVGPFDRLARNVARSLFVALVERAAARIIKIVMSVIMKNVYHKKAK